MDYLVEFIITIPDDAQHLGLGLRLITMLGDEARAHGISTFTADVQADNAKMRGLLRKLDAEFAGADGSVVRYRWAI